jgi:methyl-accepting chemotaxis protein
MTVLYLKDFVTVNEDTKSIVEAITKSGEVTATKFEGMQQSISELAKSVHELATTNNFLARDVTDIKTDIKKLDERLDKIEPAAQTMKQITDIFLKWIIPVMLIGSFGGGLAYAFFK